MTIQASFIVVRVKVSSIMIGCVRPCSRQWDDAGPGEVESVKYRIPLGSFSLHYSGGGGGEGPRISHLLESHMTYLASSHVPGAGQEYG